MFKHLEKFDKSLMLKSSCYIAISHKQKSHKNLNKDKYIISSFYQQHRIKMFSLPSIIEKSGTHWLNLTAMLYGTKPRATFFEFDYAHTLEHGRFTNQAFYTMHNGVILNTSPSQGTTGKPSIIISLVIQHYRCQITYQLMLGERRSRQANYTGQQRSKFLASHYGHYHVLIWSSHRNENLILIRQRTYLWHNTTYKQPNKIQYSHDQRTLRKLIN